jgi:hypothetical protein
MTDLQDAQGALTVLIQRDVENSTSIDDLEITTIQMIRRVVQRWLENSEEQAPEPRTRCRECGNFANYVSNRIGFIHTKFGLLRYRRAYYVCPDCHQSTCPLDERLNPTESLARLRSRIAAGRALPVAELAESWGLGRLNLFAIDRPPDVECLR